MRLRNIPVLGGCAALETAVSRVHPDEILIAIPSATSERIRAIIHRCKSLGLPIRTLPPLSDVLGGKARPTDIRNLDIEDVLGRPEITLMDPEVETTIRGKCVLVTGAGGSIGSELCRQVAGFGPAQLLLFEQSENNLHAIHIELARRFQKLHVEAILGDILDVTKLASVFGRHEPQIVFHAAAYKHVPMMEMHPSAAIRNNILGTGRVLEAARRFGVDRFVLISTDKAVAPSSVMGATKRVAEMLVQQSYETDGGRTVAVRFGNVLESSGSVVPLFREQIKKGGPVTLTHPDITRYFITISEAVRLVLHATVLGEGGETFVLDMGEPIKLSDLARLMILLSGLSPDRDIRMEYIGLRPGEKLTERLFEEDDAVSPTRHERIRRARHPPLPHDLAEQLHAFSLMDHTTDRREIEKRLMGLVPTYRPAASL
jgi:FlaA1/EpsC-like NDP-sugar epimerase